jgi:hypothetical protein
VIAGSSVGGAASAHDNGGVVAVRE